MSKINIPISKPLISDLEKQAVLAVLESGLLVQGQRVQMLETKFANLCRVKHAIATSSGTTALHVALLAHKIGPGDEVITTPFTFIASVNAILFTGAKPVLVDIDPVTYNLTPENVRKAITKRTKAIMPVHLYGHPCDMEALQSIASQHRLTIIEDACQAVGASVAGKMAGSFGTGAFSLYATKNIMSAEGGMIITNDDSVADACRLLRNHGMRQRYYYETMGYNFRLSEIHAAIGLAQFERLEEFSNRRRSNAQFLSSKIKSVAIPVELSGYKHAWHQYTIRIDRGRNRDAAVTALSEAGIGTGIFYPVPAHKQPYIRDIIGPCDLPVADQMAAEVISLPIHPQLSEHDLNYIVTEVNKL